MRILTLCLLSTALLVACQDTPESDAVTEDPDVSGPSVPAGPEEIVGDAQGLVGQWVITEQDGEAPASRFYVTFTRNGEYIVQDEAGNTQRSTFRPAGDHLIAVTDTSGTREFTYEVSEPTLTLADPDTGNTTVLTRSDDGL